MGGGISTGSSCGSGGRGGRGLPVLQQVCEVVVAQKCLCNVLPELKVCDWLGNGRAGLSCTLVCSIMPVHFYATTHKVCIVQ